MAEAWEAWKAVRAPFRDRLVRVYVGCGCVRALLANALPVLASPSVMHTLDAEGERTLLKLVVLNLMDASKDLAQVISYMEAAELLALRGWGASPTVPLPSVDHLRDDHRMARAMRLTLTRLQGSKALAQDALNRVERCRGHLWAAWWMVGHPVPGVPGVDDSIEAQRLAAVGELEAALQKAVETTAGIAPLAAAVRQAAAARQAGAGIN